MKALIIEDEHLIATEMKATIQAVAPDIEVLAILPSLKTAKAWFGEHEEPDLMFMDIKLSDGVSFDLFDEVKIKCPIIFCTAYEEFAIRAFKVNGVDYLLKPVQEEDLEKAIEKVRKAKLSNTVVPVDVKSLIDYFSPAGGNKVKYKERFIVNSNNKWTPVDAADIGVIYRENLNYLYKLNGEKLIYDYTPLEEIEELLDPDIFFRANRQTIINIHSIQTIKPYGNQKLLVILKPPLKMEIDISREKAPLLKRWLDK